MRFAAAALFWILLAVLIPCHASAQGAAPSEWQQLARDILVELIETNTTNSTGDNTEAARKMRDRLLAAGFPESDVHVIEPAPRKGNLVARLRGRNAGLDPILLLAHIDVVEADPADWTLPPFELIERDGTFFGRGVADDKDEAAIYVANLIRMKREGFVPNRDIIVALTADEEGGPTNGVSWLLENRRDLVDAAYALNEGGGGIMKDGERISNSVQASEKKFQNFEIVATNPGGHSSRPRPDNAIYELARALTAVQSHAFPVRLNEVTTAYFERTADLVDGSMSFAMRRVLADPFDAQAVDIVDNDPEYNARLRTTCVATLLEGGHASNALPQRAAANVNCRILPDEAPEDIHARLQVVIASALRGSTAAGPGNLDPATAVSILEAHGIEVRQVGRATDSPPSPLAPEILEAVESVTEEMWPGVPVVPTMSTGATDALYLRNAGIPVYGVSGLFYEDSNAHGMNENIPVQSFYEGQEFLYRLVRRLTTTGVS
jgi:acetylornithine deacetylase/succinyl-diaminopimelate desuccinylase-like protein